MFKLESLSLMLAIALLGAGLWTASAAQSGTGTGIIQGNIEAADGTAMEGVLVSARVSGKSFTTSVFTDRQGHYVFPPLDAGQYKLWAQAVGFGAGRAEFALASGGVDRKFTMAPIRNASLILRQMSGSEYLASLPQSTPADRRMVHVYNNGCTGCHTASFTLQNRWDEVGWGILIDLMSKTGSSGVAPAPDAVGNKMMLAYRDELSRYLGRVRGATELALTDLKLHARPTGEATQVVITEYDLPRPDRPLHFADGSDWSLGTPARYVGRAAHDVWADAEGNVWIADDMVPERTIAKLNPRTGEVTDYVLKDAKGKTISTHSIVVDAVGKVWAENGNDRTFLMFDPKTEQFKNFPRQADMKQGVGGTVDVDSKGNPWATSDNGAIKLDAATGQYIHYEAPPAEGGRLCAEECGNWSTYGISIDRDDNAWVTQPGLDRIVKVDARDDGDDPIAVVLAPLSLPEATEVDYERARTLRGGQNTATPLSKAPRRNAADPNDDVVWNALFHANRLARVDTKTLQVKEYALPTPYTMPYATAVDKNGVVWINGINHDALVKFDPKTERFTEYVLPTRGTEIRHVQVDNRTDPPEVWAPYNRMNKVVRLQFRTTGGPGATASR